jgi:dCMP deaminase
MPKDWDNPRTNVYPLRPVSLLQRVTRPQLFMEIAHVVSKRSTCFRLNVGAVCVIDNNIASIGYNGAAAGQAHCTGNSCPGKDGCNLTVHAEWNALKRLPKELEDKPKDIYVTDSPCEWCASVFEIHHVKRLFFSRAYRITDHLKELEEKYDTKVYQMTPAGYLIHWLSKDLVNIQ